MYPVPVFVHNSIQGADSPLTRQAYACWAPFGMFLFAIVSPLPGSRSAMGVLLDPPQGALKSKLCWVYGILKNREAPSPKGEPTDGYDNFICKTFIEINLQTRAPRKVLWVDCSHVRCAVGAQPPHYPGGGAREALLQETYRSYDTYLYICVHYSPS